MQSAACYAELAKIAGSWDAKVIEKQVWGRDSKGQNHKKRRKTFNNTKAGGLPRVEHCQRIVERHPSSDLLLCRRHPIGEILCMPELGQDGILDNLRTLSNTPIAKYIWRNKELGIFSGSVGYSTEIEDTQYSITMLSRRRSPYALQALIGRMRLNQLRGNLNLDIEFERAIWQMLPSVVARSPHLYLGQHALIAALERFFEWKPFQEWRLMLEILDESITIPRARPAYKIAVEANISKKRRLKLPPKQLVEIRKKLTDEAIIGLKSCPT